MDINSENDAYKVAKKLGEICPTVITGGHLNGRDIFYKDSLKIIEGEIFDSNNTHGSGCTYSAAATAFMEKGNPTEESVRKASYFTKKAIEHGRYGTLNQFWRFETH
jgi:hydroxymethylpyrimidine/phosphomethylpyrimidine kinase